MLAIRLIGGLEIERDGVSVDPPGSKRATALLAWLALHPGRHPRSRLAALFWPEASEAAARASLRSAVWALRAALGPDGASAVSADRDQLALVDDAVHVDAREFERLLAHSRHGEAIALCRGELLAGFADEDWVCAAREQHTARLAEALAADAAAAQDSGRPADALAATRRLLELNPFDEAACRAAMRLLAERGETSAALELYARTRRRLRAEFDCAPDPATSALAASLTAAGTRAEGVDASQAATATATAAATRIPASAVEDALSPPALPLIGRAAELSALLGLWRTARQGSGGVAALRGEGGIGKTRLCDELRAAAERSGAACASGTASGGPGAGPLLGAWSEALTVLSSGLAAGVLDEATAVRLAPILPAVPLPAAAQTPGSVLAQPRTDPGLEQVRMFESVVGLVLRAAREQPVLLVLEDLHAADHSSVELAAYLGRRLARAPVLLVLTRRELPPRRDLDNALAALHSRGALRLSLDLRRLRPTELRSVVRSVAELPASVVDQIVEAADGSPLIAVEAAQACARGGQAPILGLTEAVHAAVGRLTGPARRLVELLAVAGREVERCELPALAPDPTGRAEAEAFGSGLLRVRSGHIGFRHALLAEAVYRDLPDPLRMRLHGAFAESLERDEPGRRGGRRAAETARHLRLAGRGRQAVAQYLRAAADARAVGALPEAAEFLREATTIDADGPAALLELAEVEAWRGLLDASDTAFDRALAVLGPGDDAPLIDAWLRRGRWLRGGLCHPRESRRSYSRALELLERQAAADPLIRATALAGLAWAEAVAGDPARCETLLREVSATVGRAAAPGDLLSHDIGVARAHALIRSGRFADAYAPLIAASAAALRAARPDMAYSCLINAASAAACAGQFERSLDFAQRCIPLVEPHGLLRLCVYTHSARAAILRRLGRLDEALAACAVEAGFAARLGLPELEGLACHDEALVAAALGQSARAAELLARTLELNAPVSRASARLARAEALARCTRADEAAAELRRTALEPLSASDFPDTLVARMNRVQALISLARGDRPAARAGLEASAAAWRRRGDADTAGRRYVAALIDLGRPPLSSLVEPERELTAVSAELDALAGAASRPAGSASPSIGPAPGSGHA